MKRKIFIFNILILSLIFSQNIGMPCFAQKQIQTFQGDKAPLQVLTPSDAQEKPDNKGCVYTYSVKKEQSDVANELNIFLAGYLNDINTHNIKKIGDYYASNYMSGDGFSKNQAIDLIKQTWKNCPDLKYSTVIKNLRLDNNRASIEFCEEVTGTTKNKSDITKDNGFIKGTSHYILYLEKYGSGWKIVTDKTLYEQTSINYGRAKNINMNFDVPEQVFAGENYTALLKIDVPPDVFALGSLTSVPFVFPEKQPEENFRQIPSDLNTIERVIKSNKDSFNEISSASVSFCEAGRTAYTGLDLKVTGLAVILRRINVIPNLKSK
jgi:hypothetical protein